MRWYHHALESGSNIFDSLHCFWEGEKNLRRVSSMLAIVFVASLFAIELSRLGLLPNHLARIVPTNHFYAVNVAFTLVLITEVVSMILVLPKSFSRSVGKQFEILALILLRNSFKELIYIGEPVELAKHLDPFLRIMSDGAGAMAVFVLLAIYRKLPSTKETVRNGPALYTFVVTKKVLSLLLLLVFLSLGGFNAWLLFSGQELIPFFKVFYTVLIFSDIFVVLIAQRFMPTFDAIFRNSGLALSTLFIRLALSAPPYYNALLGVLAAGFAVCLTLSHNLYNRQKRSPGKSSC